MIQDRRSGYDRRSSRRYGVETDVEWERGAERYSDRLSDISDGGCFVLSGKVVAEGERVKMFLPISEGVKIPFPGEVANHVFEIGFAIKFARISAAQKDFLESFLDTHVSVART